MRHLCALACALLLCASAAAESPAVRQFRTQKVGDTIFFRVDLAQPARMLSAPPPRLLPQDDGARVVVPLAGEEFAFVGQWSPTREAGSLKLVYFRAGGSGKPEMVEAQVTLRHTDARPTQDNLDTAWARAQMAEFAVLQRAAPDFGFYPLARLLLARKYGLVEPTDLTMTSSPEAAHRKIFETHTGGAALAESLQLHRLLRRDRSPTEARTVSVSTIPGITIPEHPWVRMMAGAQPAEEALATFAPADNYFVRFRDLHQLLEFGDLLELWGGNLIHALEFQTRDAAIRTRYEQQLCLPSRRLAKAIQPDRIKGIAVTGSDPYLVDGTDLTVVFHLSRTREFLQDHDALIAEARAGHREQWREATRLHRGITIQSFATPRREISLFRAVTGNFVLCSNSLIAIQRALDARSGDILPLAQSLDYRYMRTVFRADAPDEDGFAFLPDAFIRRLMSPADKIKQRRRAESLGRLALAQNAALFAAWESGTIPPSLPALTATTKLKPEDLLDGEGRPIRWDGLAYSEVHNTISFATPLIELSIDQITPTERREYELFRTDYLRLWNQFFDPVGLRFRNGPKQAQLEAYILPLVQSENYRLLRQISSGSPMPIPASLIPKSTLMQVMVKLGSGDDGLFLLRLEDDPAFAKRMKLLVNAAPAVELDKVFWELPLTLGIITPKSREGNDSGFSFLRQVLRDNFTAGHPDQMSHRGTEILQYRVDAVKARDTLAQLRSLVRAQAGGDGASTLDLLMSFLPEKQMPEFIYQASIGNGYYLSLNKECLKRIIDQQEGASRTKASDPIITELNTGLYIAPGSPHSSEAIRQYLEWQVHRRSLLGNALWLPLYRAGLVAPEASPGEARAAALRWWGFEPVSPDGAAYRYDRGLGEVVNVRHGTPQRPNLRSTLTPDAPARQLLERFRALRTDLKFREDGIHTTVTFERKK